MDQRAISGAVFDSGSFSTSSFSVDSWDFGEVTPSPVRDPGGYTGFIADLQEEEELLVIFQAFIHMINKGKP